MSKYIIFRVQLAAYASVILLIYPVSLHQAEHASGLLGS